MKKLLVSSVASLALTACGTGNVSSTSGEAPVTTETTAPMRTVETTSPDVWGEGHRLNRRNTDVHPGDDFFMHVNGLCMIHSSYCQTRRAMAPSIC